MIKRWVTAVVICVALFAELTGPLARAAQTPQTGHGVSPVVVSELSSSVYLPENAGQEKVLLAQVNFPVAGPREKKQDEGITEASLSKADLAGTDLRDRDDLHEISFRGKNLYQSILQGVQIMWADFSGAQMNEADMSGAVMAFGDFSKTDLRDAKMANANLQGANFQGANLAGADLNGANLQGVNLLWANLSNTDLQGVNLTQTNPAWANVREAKYNSKTKFPAGFNPKKHGMIFVPDEKPAQ